MKYSLFILDYDALYPDVEITPGMFLVGDVKVAESCARKASDRFHSDDTGEKTICELFEEAMEEVGVHCESVGPLNVRAEDRIGDYLEERVVCVSV